MAGGCCGKRPGGWCACAGGPCAGCTLPEPKEYTIAKPGDLVQVDTLDVRPLAGVAFKHYTARDVVSRWDVVQAYGRATAETATAFLDGLTARMPFPVKAIQVDGGSEFQAQFERACAARDIRLFVLPPRSPKLNAHVERVHRTRAEDLDGDLDLGTINRALHRSERVYNTVRPHRSLAKKAPAEYLQHYYPRAAARAHLSHMSRTYTSG